MPKFLIEGTYVGEGVKGLAQEGGTKRQDAVRKFAESVGGKVEAFYYAFGETDVYVIVELPDATSAAAMTLAINGSGKVRVRTTVLLTPEEVDAASRKTAAYSPPGG